MEVHLSATRDREGGFDGGGRAVEAKVPSRDRECGDVLKKKCSFGGNIPKRFWFVEPLKMYR